MTIRVTPRGDQWTVEQNGVTVSNHRLKRRAKQRARSKAKNGEEIVIYGTGGQIQESITRTRGR